MRRVARVSGCVILFAAAAASAQDPLGVPSELDAETRRLLVRLGEAHAKVGAYELTGELSMNGDVRPLRCRFMPPNFWKMEFEGSWTAGCTGTVNYADLVDRTYSQTLSSPRQPVKLDLFPSGDGHLAAMVALPRWRAIPPAMWFLDGAYLAPRAVTGAAHPTLVAEPYFSGSGQRTIVFDRDTLLLREVTIEGRRPARLTVSRVRTDVTFSEGDFAWRPRPGTRRIAGSPYPDLVAVNAPDLGFTDLSGERRSLRALLDQGVLLVVTDPYNHGPWRFYEQLADAVRHGALPGLRASVVVLFWDYAGAGAEGLRQQLALRRFEPVGGITYGVDGDEEARKLYSPKSPGTTLIGPDGRITAQWRGWGTGILADVAAAAALMPTRAEALRTRGEQAWARGDHDGARREFFAAAELGPDEVDVQLGLARFLSTCRSAAHRDGARALLAAERALAGSTGRPTNVLDALAAARAAKGEVELAITLQEESLAAMNDRTLPDRRDEARMRVELFRRRRPAVTHAFEGPLLVQWVAAPVRAGTSGAGRITFAAVEHPLDPRAFRLHLDPPPGFTFGTPTSVDRSPVHFSIPITIAAGTRPDVYAVKTRLSYLLVPPGARATGTPDEVAEFELLVPVVE